MKHKHYCVACDALCASIMCLRLPHGLLPTSQCPPTSNSFILKPSTLTLQLSAGEYHISVITDDTDAAELRVMEDGAVVHSVQGRALQAPVPDPPVVPPGCARPPDTLDIIYAVSHPLLVSQPGLVACRPEAEVAMKCLVAVKDMAGVSNGPKFNLINQCISTALHQPQAQTCAFFQEFFSQRLASRGLLQHRRGLSARSLQAPQRRRDEKIFVLPPPGERDWFADPDEAQLISMPGAAIRRNLELFRQGDRNVRPCRLPCAREIGSPVPVPPQLPCPGVQVLAAVQAVVKLAEEYAAKPDMSVTSKRVIPPTGDKRTYLSLDTYSWPANNSTTDPVGPWYKRDGYPFPGVRCQRLSTATWPHPHTWNPFPTQTTRALGIEPMTASPDRWTSRVSILQQLLCTLTSERMRAEAQHCARRTDARGHHRVCLCPRYCVLLYPE